MLSTLLIAVFCGAPQASSDAAFAQGLAEVREKMAAELWPAARLSLKKLLAEHERREYVLGFRDEILRIDRACAFHEDYKPPKDQDLVSATECRYDPKKGTIRLVYEPANLNDFQKGGAGRIHPLVFDGEHEVEFKGGLWPEKQSISGFLVEACAQEGESYEVFSGSPWVNLPSADRVSFHARIARKAGNRMTKLAVREDPPMKPGKPYRFRVVVRDREIAAYYNATKIVEAEKDPGCTGQLSFAAVAQWEELVISGKVRPGWLEARRTVAWQKEWERHVSTYRPTTLPEWLLENEQPGIYEPWESKDMPESVKEDWAPGVQLFQAYLAAGDRERAAALLDAEEGWDFPESLRSWLMMQLHLERGELAAALSCCERTLDKEPKFLGGILLRIQLLQRLGRHNAAWKEASELVGRFPNAASAYAAAVEEALRAGDHALAESWLSRSLGWRQSDPRLAELSASLDEARQGPVWATASAHLRKDEALELIAQSASVRLEKWHELIRDAQSAAGVALDGAAAAAPPPAPPLRAFLFPSQEAWKAYGSRGFVAGETPLAARYDPLLRQIVFWEHPEEARLQWELRGAAVIAEFDRRGVRGPDWLILGLALCHAGAAAGVAEIPPGEKTLLDAAWSGSDSKVVDTLIEQRALPEDSWRRKIAAGRSLVLLQFLKQPAHEELLAEVSRALLAPGVDQELPADLQARLRETANDTRLAAFVAEWRR